MGRHPIGEAALEDSNRQLLQNALNQLELGVEPSVFERLVRFHDLLMEVNQSMNLTGHKDEAESVTKNLVNALAPWRSIRQDARTLDVGSGGGFPGLPLAIALDLEELCLVESKQKKAKFLEEACAEVAPKVRVLNNDVNMIREAIDQVLVCGFGTLSKIQQVTKESLILGGKILAWKGSIDRVREEIAECLPYHRNWNILPFSVPGLEAERHLCVWMRM